MTSEPDTSSATILVVDDDAANRMVAAGHLEAAGYSVVEAAGGAEALGLFEAQHVDLVLLDMMMPGMDGFETCRRLRDLPGGGHAPVLFLTALSDARALRKVLEVGGDDLLTKPVRSGELLLRVRSLLRVRRLYDHIEQKSQALRDAMEARADRSEKRYQTLFGASNDAVVIHGLDGVIHEVNARAVEWFGYEPEEIRGLRIFDLHPPHDRHQSRTALEAIRLERSVLFEAEFRRKDGSVFPAEVSATLFELDGHPTVQSFVRDITARRAAEADLEAARQKERAATELLGKIRAAQEAFIAGHNALQVLDDLLAPLLALTGSRYGFIGEVLEAEGGPVLRVRSVRGAGSVPQQLQGIEPLEYRADHPLLGPLISSQRPVVERAPRTGLLPDGRVPLSTFLCLPLVSGVDLVGAMGFADRPTPYDSALIEQLAPFLATAANVLAAERSDRLRWESDRALRSAEAQLRQAQKLEALGQLAGGVAHDFNNLLTAIVSFTQLAKDELPAGHGAAEDLSEVLRAARSAAELTNQLLSFSRRRPVKPRVLDVRATLHEVERMLARTLGENIALSVALCEDELPVKIDPGALNQVLFNLCVNARDAMPEGGTLALQVIRQVITRPPPTLGGKPLEPGTYAAISVADTGTGIADEHLGRIFDPFFSTKGEGGTGLGLATCYGIAKQAGGELTVQTQHGRGSTFTLLLPIADRVKEENASALRAPLHAAENRTVLVVEDQTSILRVMNRILAGASFRVIEARTAEDGLELADTADLDLVVTDIVLPGKTGLWLLEKLRERRPGLPALLVSGYIAEDGPPLPLDASTGFLAKPFTGSELHARALELVGAPVSG